ncbi:MAG TPA: ATP-binding protein [Candidatus Eremiobacteraceae bacterium]|nr:ATP-binding protein [Candidatus Eremiobacteraceae bacterium]
MIQSLSDNQFTIEQAVHSAARRLRAANVEQETAAGVVLAIIEALGNVARHACKPFEPLRFELLLEVKRGCIVVDVVDYGPGFELRRATMPDPFAESGRGIPLMQRFCDSLEYRRGRSRNHLILRKRLAEAQQSGIAAR